MQITKIEKQKQAGRYNLYLDGQFWLGIGEDVLVQLGLHKDQNLDQALMDKIAYLEQVNKYYLKAVIYLSYGLRTVREMEAYLDQAIPADQATRSQDIRQIIDKLKAQSYLDDLSYGQAYVRTKMTINRKGPYLIKQELLAKGLSDLDIDQALAEYPYDLGQDNIIHLGQKFLARQKQASKKMALDKVYHYLLTKGYPADWLNEVDFGSLLGDQDRDEGAILGKQASKLLRTQSRKYSGQVLKAKLIQSLMAKGFAYPLIQAWLDKQEEYFMD